MLLSSNLRVGLVLTSCLVATSNMQAQFSTAKAFQAKQERPRISCQHLQPHELQFGCGMASDGEEQKLAKWLATGEPDQQLAAARALWEGHSRRQASNVIKYLAGPPPGGKGFRQLQRAVEAALKPQAILRELEEGDYLWAPGWPFFDRTRNSSSPCSRG